jgi:hypothetical protein
LSEASAANRAGSSSPGTASIKPSASNRFMEDLVCGGADYRTVLG